MKLIALDSSGNVAAVAIFADGRILGEYRIDHKTTHSQTLLPMLSELCGRVDFAPAEADAIAVASGPGSFTGLRIGAAAAKGMAEALGIGILPVPTLEALCYCADEWKGVICPLLDARRSQVYSGIYRFSEEGSLQTLVPGEALPLGEQLERLEAYPEECLFLGDGSDAYRGALEERFGNKLHIARPHRRYQSAAAVCMRAGELGRGAIIKAEDFAPEYLRRSQAEREREERLKGEQA
ncbi:MAG: tRNA (adenosine(37)-N6)-threonylcarbamoyltransferase complex dimerization subunit type 1 TsaB [Lachnospiraceae bacterium]|nr:tRNA (adenosine(37)-N6)-threonylcarbamoyltransferase complex dimerization subunit type 1 TsaB [Lachnospiraceae bacterium]